MATDNPLPVTPDLYWRDFNRTVLPDLDFKVDSAFASSHISAQDVFGRLLLNRNSLSLITLHQVVMHFWNEGLQKSGQVYTIEVFGVADGAIIKPDPQARPWFNPHVRLVVLVTTDSSGKFKPDKWSAFIVGSWAVQATDSFLQVASWDGAQFNFYQFSQDPNYKPTLMGWTYQGSSPDAFDPEKSYLGPFNGHVNGGPVMKELESPWLHWQSSFTSIKECFNNKIIDALDSAKPWLAPDPGNYKFTEAPTLQQVIQSGVTSWMRTRKKNAFLNVDGSLKDDVPIQRWMAHVLLTTTINIGCAAQSESDFLFIPWDFFFDQRLYGALGLAIAGAGGKGPRIHLGDYQNGVKELGLCLLQEIDDLDEFGKIPEALRVQLPVGSLGGGKETGEHNMVTFVRVADAEGDDGKGYFTFLTSSFEDARGATQMQSIRGATALLSDQAMRCLLGIDIPNPIYSWRRGILMQYCPVTTSVTSDGAGYDCESKWVGAIRNSAYAKIQDSPEYAFLNFYDHFNEPNQGDALITTNFQNYASSVHDRAKTKEGVMDFMKLAESRRRLYRPVPLNEFGYTLPYAVDGNKARDIPVYEMDLKAELHLVTTRGLQWLAAWTGTLWTTDPHLIPTYRDQIQSAMFATSLDISPAPIVPWLLPLKAGTRPLGAAGMAHGNIPPRPPLTCPASQRRRTVNPSKQVISAKLASTCPVSEMSLTFAKSDTSPNVPSQPTWDDDIGPLFMSPYWVSDDPAQQQKLGSRWRGAMIAYGNHDEQDGSPFDLHIIKTVRDNVLTIYQHLRSQSMPVTDNPAQLWPEAALELLREWANQGFRQGKSDPVRPRHIIPAPNDPPVKFRIRKDIRSLTDLELNVYRAKLDDMLQVLSLGSKWQELCRLHGEWCMHYQEAFGFWHRAYLHYVEDLIDYGIPYWNVCDAHCADPNSEAARIPQAFLDDTYVHPHSGETRPNPLKHAIGLDGRSTAGGTIVTRDPVLVKQDSQSPEWKDKIVFATQYLAEVSNALAQATFSYPQNVTTGEGRAFGIPWANIPKFTQDEDPKQYIYENRVFHYVPNFDGFFEQVHDNWHGWIGGAWSTLDGKSVNGDMADNTTTAVDPLFLSFHANIDRILTTYLETHPQTMYTANFPLRPFINKAKYGVVDFASELDYDEPRVFLYTTIGDMAKDTKALRYIYGPPKAGDADICEQYKKSRGLGGGKKLRTGPSGGSTLLEVPNYTTGPGNTWMKASTDDKPIAYALHPQIVFTNIKCTELSYTIDCFATVNASKQAQPYTLPEFLGRITRLGMGRGSGTAQAGANATAQRFSQCRKSPVTRTLVLEGKDSTIIRQVAKNGFVQVVTELQTSRVVPEDEWKTWDGFTGVYAVGVNTM